MFISNNNNTVEVENSETLSLPHIKNGRVIMYLHVGKTGGTSLDKVLASNCKWYSNRNKGFPCRKNLMSFNGTKYEETTLSFLTKETIHIKFPYEKLKKWMEQDVTSFLFTVRNPISRAVSSFNMDHAKNVQLENPELRYFRTIFYESCFPKVENLMNVLKNKNKTVLVEDARKDSGFDEIDCFEIGKSVLEGNGHIMYNTHLTKNYENYYNFTSKRFPRKEILIIRTEELQNDLILLNDALYNDDNQTQGFSSSGLKEMKNLHYTHGSEQWAADSEISEEEKAVMCCYLSKENQIFEDLVRSAANLVMLEKEKYLKILYSDCGIVVEDKDLTKRIRIEGGKTSRSFDWTRWRSESSNCDF